jgi:cellulose synthase (UDP-forming)
MQTATGPSEESEHSHARARRPGVSGSEHAIPPRGDAIGIGGTPQTRFGIWWEQHPRLVHLVLAAAVATQAMWLGVRAWSSWRGVNPLAFSALFAVEVYNLIALALLGFSGWQWTRTVPPPPPTREFSVDVFVCTYDEPVDVVEATLAGCAALRYPHTTYLLDDGRRPEMSVLADRWGAKWITRPDNRHAKAGNINHALEHTDGELIFFLDADHVPLPDALDLTVGYFENSAVALVQSPHDFYNQDSVQHYGPGRHEQSLFFNVISPGKDRDNSAFWCGSATLVRRRALVQVGGVATETIAEDFHTTIKMHRIGWRTRYHNEVLVQGLAPVDLDGYLLQRDRWARGNLAVLRLPESPLSRRSGLSRRQRVAYFSGLFAYGAGLARLTLIAMLVLALGPGVLPAEVSLAMLLALWLPSTVLAMTATAAVCRGHMRLGESSHYTLLTAEVFTRALRCAFFPSRTKFKVTPKEGTDSGGWQAVRRLHAVLILGAALVVSMVWRTLAVDGFVPARKLPGIALPFAMVLASWELLRIVRTLVSVSRRRQRRMHFRFECRLPALVSDRMGIKTTATVTDISLAGIGLALDVPLERGASIEVGIAVAGVDGQYRIATINGFVRSIRPDRDGGMRAGIQIADLDDVSRRRIATFCHVVHPWEQLRGRERCAEFRRQLRSDGGPATAAGDGCGTDQSVVWTRTG